jgi:MarR family 2-MHQ and catechol resistance regulon transcriptional repressor
MAPKLRDSRTLSLLRALHRAYRSVNCADGQHIQDRFGLHQSEFDVLATLGNTDGLSMGEIAQRMLTSPGNVTRLVKKMEERGFVERQRAPWSDRVVIAKLTPEGGTVFEESYPAQVAFLEGLFAGRLEVEQQERLTELLDALASPSGEEECAGPCCDEG